MADDLEKELCRDLQESKTVIAQAGAKIRAGGAPIAEMTRLKSVGEKVRASHLLMLERLRQRSDRASSLGAKAVERQNKVAAAYEMAINDYLAMIDALTPDGTVSAVTLDALITLLDKIVPPKKRPLLGTLPYKHLGYPARESATLPTVVPAYKGGNRTVNPVDTAESAEAPIAAEITALAQSLQWNPVLIYEWVKNNVETEWYWGVMKGADETLRQKSGNDADQSALLVALLRASGFPSRFVKGTIEFFPDIEKVKNITGISDPMKIAAFFQKAGIPFKPAIAGGGIANFQVEHIWVESQVPYSNYRGAVIDDMGKSWLGLDTSIKPAGYTRNTPLDVPPDVTASVRDDYLQGMQDKTPLEFLRRRVGDYLSANQPGKGWQDVLATRTLIPDVLKIIPSSLQFKQIAVTGEYTELPAELRYQMRFTATSGVNQLFTLALDVMRLSNRKVTLTYEPETVEDQQIIDSFGGLDNTPSYLVHLRPVLKLDGERIVVAQDGLPMGADYSLTTDVVTPNGTETVTSTQIAGNLSVVGIVGGKAVSPAPIADSDDAEGILFKEAIGYIDRWNQAEDELAAFYKVAVSRPVPTVVTVGGVIDVTYLLDVPHGFEWKGVFIDAALRGIETISQSSDAGQEQGFMRLSALQGSVLENRVFEDDFKVESVSTAKLLQLANANGTPLVTIDKTNIDAILPTLSFDDAVKQDIANAVNQNLVVTIPQAEMTYRDWTGIGYVKENRETGESGWMLSGQVAGGMTAVDKESWIQQDIVETMGIPTSPKPNTDVSAAYRILRIMDYQDGKAGTKLSNAFQARVVDKNNVSVKGVPVTFIVIAGGGTLKGETRSGTAIGTAGAQVTVATGADGIARARLTLGQHTSDSPYYVYALPNSILVGQNLVTATAPTDTKQIVADKPFEAYAYPGDAVKLVKVAESTTDNVNGNVNTYSGPAWVKVTDQYDNPVSNKKVTFTVGQQAFLGDAPTGEAINAKLLADYNSCPGMPTAICDQATPKPVEKITDSAGAFVSVILGNTDNTRYPVNVTAKKDLNGKETADILTTTFNHYSYAVQKSGDGSPRYYLAALSVYHADETGKRIDAGLAGNPLAVPLETTLFYYEEDAINRGTFSTSPVTDGTVNYTVAPGGGSVMPAMATLAANGNYQTALTLGASGINRITAVGSILRHSQTLQAATSFRIWAVKPEVTPNQLIYVNKYGYPETDTKLLYKVTPPDYTAYTRNLLIYEDGSYMGFIPGSDGYALLSQGGAKFDITKKYTAQLVLNLGTKLEIRSAEVPLNITMLCLIPDYDHNRVIDQKDRDRALNKDTYYFWVNDDDESGDTVVTDIPGSGDRTSHHDNVGGTRDLVDWFSVNLDIGDLLTKLDSNSYTYKLKHEEGYLDFVYAGLAPQKSGDYLTGSVAFSLASAATIPITSQGYVLPQFIIDQIKNGQGVIIVEGWKATKKPLVLEIADQNGKTVFTSSLNLSIDGVEKMFRHKNFIAAAGGWPPVPGTIGGEFDRLDEPTNYPDTECNKKNFVFVHGYNVNGQQARGWQAEMFKRMYWSGSKAKFWGVTWYGSDSQIVIFTKSVTPNYHVNVIHALDTAEYFKNFILSNVKGDVTIAAHSLGNMLVSKTLSDWRSIWESTANPKIKNYFLIDAAVPEEAYNDPEWGYSAEKNDMVHPDWALYNRNLWASEWYQLFTNDQSSDYRSSLTWRGRFKDRPQSVPYYNFYSSGEDVLDIHIGAPHVIDIATEGIGRYAWALQEKLKGVLSQPGVLGSTYGGWGFNFDKYASWEVSLTGGPEKVIFSPDKANNLAPLSIFRIDPFFSKRPEDADLYKDVTGGVFASQNKNRLLADAIPALTFAAGKKQVDAFGTLYNNFDMQARFKNGWPPERSFDQEGNKWKHSDVKEIAYTYLYPLFVKLSELGGLDQ